MGYCARHHLADGAAADKYGIRFTQLMSFSTFFQLYFSENIKFIKIV
jgi:hypothetical protein